MSQINSHFFSEFYSSQSFDDRSSYKPFRYEAILPPLTEEEQLELIKKGEFGQFNKYNSFGGELTLRLFQTISYHRFPIHMFRAIKGASDPKDAFLYFEGLRVDSKNSEDFQQKLDQPPPPELFSIKQTFKEEEEAFLFYKKKKYTQTDGGFEDFVSLYDVMLKKNQGKFLKNYIKIDKTNLYKYYGLFNSMIKSYKIKFDLDASFEHRLIHSDVRRPSSCITPEEEGEGDSTLLFNELFEETGIISPLGSIFENDDVLNENILNNSINLLEEQEQSYCCPCLTKCQKKYSNLSTETVCNSQGTFEIKFKIDKNFTKIFEKSQNRMDASNISLTCSLNGGYQEYRIKPFFKNNYEFTTENWNFIPESKEDDERSTRPSRSNYFPFNATEINDPVIDRGFSKRLDVFLSTTDRLKTEEQCENLSDQGDFGSPNLCREQYNGLSDLYDPNKSEEMLQKLRTYFNTPNNRSNELGFVSIQQKMENSFLRKGQNIRIRFEITDLLYVEPEDEEGFWMLFFELDVSCYMGSLRDLQVILDLPVVEKDSPTNEDDGCPTRYGKAKQLYNFFTNDSLGSIILFTTDDLFSMDKDDEPYVVERTQLLFDRAEKSWTNRDFDTLFPFNVLCPKLEEDGSYNSSNFYDFDLEEDRALASNNSNTDKFKYQKNPFFFKIQNQNGVESQVFIEILALSNKSFQFRQIGEEEKKTNDRNKCQNSCKNCGCYRDRFLKLNLSFAAPEITIVSWQEEDFKERGFFYMPKIKDP